MASLIGCHSFFFLIIKPKNGSFLKSCRYVIMIDPLVRNYFTVTVIAFLIAPFVSH